MNKNFFYIFSVALALLSFGPCQLGTAQISNYKAYSIFIYSFSKYVHWPPEANNKEFKIAVVGKSQVFDELSTMAQTKNREGQKIVVTQVNDAEDIDFAHIVYITEGKSSTLAGILAKTSTTPVLVITERDGLIKKGAGISFLITEENSLRFELNEEAIAKRNLKVAKNLQTLAYKE